MGLLGSGENNTGLFFLIVVVVLAFAFIYIARGGELPSAPSIDFNSGDAVSLFQLSDSNSSGLDSLFPSWPSGEGSSDVEAYFCPQDGCAGHLIDKINEANSSLFIAIYSFTNDEIADAVIGAKNRGVEVKVIFDYDQSKVSGSDDERLFEAGIPVVLRNGAGYMHNKFAVIDANIVATGSFNYSNNADTKNEENLVFIRNQNIARQFKDDFDSIWSASTRAG